MGYLVVMPNSDFVLPRLGIIEVFSILGLGEMITVLLYRFCYATECAIVFLDLSLQYIRC